jgi:hypothetical protein
MLIPYLTNPVETEGDRVLVDFLAGKVREVCAAALDSPPEVNNLLTELRTGLSPPASPPPPHPPPASVIVSQ